MLSIIDDRKAFADKLLEQCERYDENIDIVHLNKAKEKLEKRREKFKEMYAEGLISMDELKAEYNAVESGIKSIDAELCGMGNVSERSGKINITVENLESVIIGAELSNDDMRCLVKKVMVYHDKVVEIYMK